MRRISAFVLLKEVQSAGLSCLSGVYEVEGIDHPQLASNDSAYDRNSEITQKLSDCAICNGHQHVTKGVFAYYNNVAAPAVLAGEAKPKDRLTLWHKRLGHLGSDSLERLVKEQMVSGMKLPEKEFKGTKENL